MNLSGLDTVCVSEYYVIFFILNQAKWKAGHTGNMKEDSCLLSAVRMEAARVAPFEVDKEVGRKDLQYNNAEGGLKDARLAEADDDGRWPPRAGELPHS